MLKRKNGIPAVIAGGGLLAVGVWLLSADYLLTADEHFYSAREQSQSVAPLEDSRKKEDAPNLIMSQPTAGALTTSSGLNPANSAAGTLNDQIERALSINDGPGAASLAAKLNDCDIGLRILAVESSQGAQPNSDPAVQAIRLARLQEYERLVASCQTVPGDRNQLRLRLLDLAVQQGIMGAAVESFEAGSREPRTVSRVVGDAILGDLKSLTTIAMYDAKVFNVSRDVQDAARYALQLASNTPITGRRVVNYLKIAESYAAPNSEFDSSKISGAARTQGMEIASRLNNRLEQKVRSSVEPDSRR
ncbi:MAG: hypothetical protein ACOVP3_04170 [Rhodoluna sp.]